MHYIWLGLCVCVLTEQEQKIIFWVLAFHFRLSQAKRSAQRLYRLVLLLLLFISLCCRFVWAAECVSGSHSLPRSLWPFLGPYFSALSLASQSQRQTDRDAKRFCHSSYVLYNESPYGTCNSEIFCMRFSSQNKFVRTKNREKCCRLLSSELCFYCCSACVCLYALMCSLKQKAFMAQAILSYRKIDRKRKSERERARAREWKDTEDES